MAGGSGTRLWPISRCNLPKQLHNLCSDKSLIQETYDRIKGLVPQENIYVSLVKTILKTSQKQLPGIPRENFIVEPEAKNTAPAIALVGATIFRQNPKAIVITLASDHSVEKLGNFRRAIKTVFAFTEQNPKYFTTVGIKPTAPDTSLGYIKVGKKFPGFRLFEVERFEEKPNLKKAKEYLRSGKYLWNASYFIWQADRLLEIYKKYAPRIFKGVQKLMKAGDNQKKIEEIYQKMPAEPIDTVVAEKVAADAKMAVLPVDLGWSDIGNWTTLYDFLSQKTGNQTISRGNHIGIDDKNCLIYAQDKLLTTVGLKDIIIVDTPDVTLVCDKNRAQDVKKLIEKIKEKGRDKYL